MGNMLGAFWCHWDLRWAVWLNESVLDYGKRLHFTGVATGEIIINKWEGDAFSIEHAKILIFVSESFVKTWSWPTDLHLVKLTQDISKTEDSNSHPTLTFSKLLKQEQNHARYFGVPFTFHFANGLQTHTQNIWIQSPLTPSFYK